MKSEPFHWPANQRCAVSLTYDDALPVHYETVGPSLVQAGLRGTFNLTITGDPLEHPEAWRELARAGHELANHTLFHPCRRTPPANYGWLEEHYDLCDYTPQRFEQELRVANLVLYLLDGKHERTYGNTCCNTTIGRGDQETSMDGILRKLFVAARGPINQHIADPRAGINLLRVGHFSGDAEGGSLTTIQQEIDEAAEMGGWIVFMIHGVGKGTHDLYMETETHEKLIDWLREKRQEVWTAPFIEVAKYVRDKA